MKILLAINTLVVSAVLGFSCQHESYMRQHKADLPPVHITTNTEHANHPSIIRLNNPEGFFFCTGFVIDNNYAMTAAHCVLNSIGYIKNDDIIISDQYSMPTTVIAHAVAVDRYLDIAFIKGDFSKFEFKPVDFYGKYFKRGMIMQSCGFPAGMYFLYCTELQHVGNYNFQYRTNGGPIFKGCSGGPVIDPESGYVIGVNSAVSQDNVIIAPVIGSLESAGL